MSARTCHARTRRTQTPPHRVKRISRHYRLLEKNRPKLKLAPRTSHLSPLTSHLAMRWTHTLIPTLKETPADAEITSPKLLPPAARAARSPRADRRSVLLSPPRPARSAQGRAHRARGYEPRRRS